MGLCFCGGSETLGWNGAGFDRELNVMGHSLEDSGWMFPDLGIRLDRRAEAEYILPDLGIDM